MNDPVMTILTVNYNTSEFVDLVLYACLQLVKNSYQVIVCDNGSTSTEIDRLRDIVMRYDNVQVIFRRQTRVGSFGHGEALDLLIPMVHTRYTVILDSDCVFLLKHWDALLIEQLNDDVKIVGTPIPIGRSGHKPTDFALLYGALFDTEIYKQLNISCLPRDLNHGEDTCWEWRHKFLRAGFKGKIFEARSTRDYSKGRFGGIVCTEYYNDTKQLIAVHFGRGSTGGIQKYQRSWYRYVPGLSLFIPRLIARNAKRQWLSKCYDLINEQV